VLFPIWVLLGRLGPDAAGVLAVIATFYFALFAISTMALYLARTYKNGVARPLFIVDKRKTLL
jgi:hypothetical protein